MSAIQLSFSLRTANVKQVHLIGSWDGYQGQLPLSRDGSKWKGTFRFSSKVMQAGQRYWFYYMLDGYKVSHDPSKEFTVEPTTSRKLNILDVPASASSKSSSRKSSSSSKVPTGRPATEIRSPKPVRPGHVAKDLEAAARQQAALEALSARFAESRLEDSDDDSDCDSDVPSLTSSVSNCSTPSSVSSTSSSCSCARYGITRAGQRVLLDCGGSRCGYSEDDCSSEEEYVSKKSASRRHGVVIA